VGGNLGALIRKRFPTIPIVVRGDSAFAMPRLMHMLDRLNAEGRRRDDPLVLAPK